MAITFTGGKTWVNGDIANATNMNLIVNALTTSMATSRLLGRTTAGSGAFEEITPGLGLDYSSTAISVGWIDTNSTHYLRIAAGSDLTADRTLTLTTGDAGRTLTLNGNATLNDWFDQSVKTTASPTFAGLSTGSGAISGGAISGTTGTFSSTAAITGAVTMGTNSIVTASAANANLAIDSQGGSGRQWVLSSRTDGTFKVRDATGSVDRISIDTAGGNGPWGQTTPAAGSFTTLSASGSAGITATNGPLIVQGDLPSHGASRASLSFVSGGAYLYGYGANAGTAGTITLGVRSSDASINVSTLAVSSTGLAVTGQSTATTFLRAGTTNVHASTVGISAYDNTANTQIGLGQNGGSLILQWVYNATAGNASAEITSTTSNPLTIISKRLSVDTTVASSLRVENNGDIVFGADSALATSATSQFVHIRTMAGAPSGSPTNYTGHAVHCVDTTNGRAYYYYGAAWHYATLT